jgi:hypothetical protein
MTSKWLRMCAVIQVLVATSAASGEPISPAPGHRSGTADTKSATSSGRNDASPSTGTLTPSLRMTIATFLERQERFRKYDDDGAPKLVEARIAGPAEAAQPSSRKQPIYCIRVDLIMTNRILWVSRDALEAVITFPPPGENGEQRIQGRVWSVTTHAGSTSCNHVPYTPFPELEQLRAQRRHALGKADS